MQNPPIIIGAGISGLVAAIELEKAGYEPIIVEQSDRVGGRVKTDWEGEIPLDHGFQVLLTEYPEAQRYLDYEALDLVKFLPGSVIYKNGKKEKIGDPTRDLSFLWTTTFASIGSMNDKRKILQLSQALKSKSIADIFIEPEKTTKAYLTEKGFSDEMIADFFQPFFSGIFLEKELSTSSRMFEFVYKMFGTGYAAVPRKGMQAIPDQLKSKLTKTTFLFNTKVNAIRDQTVYFENGGSRSADAIILATDPTYIINHNFVKQTKWKSCYNLYFEVEKSTLEEPIIGLIADENTLVNNFHFLTDVYGKEISSESVLSVTVVGESGLDAANLVAKVRTELKEHCQIETKDLIKIFHIKEALPDVSELVYSTDSKSQEIQPGVYLCGDHTANGSLNAAMASGRAAAEQALAFDTRLRL